MKIFDSNGPMRQMVGVVATVIRETSHKGPGNFAWEFPSRNAFFCWALILTTSLLMVSGCSRYKEELEGAKQQIEKLNAEVNRLTQETARLKEETSRLSDESKALADKNTRMQQDLDGLNKAKAALSTENKDLQKKNKAAEEEITSLKGEKARLAKEIEELKKRVAQMAPPPAPPMPSTPPVTMPTEVGPQSAKQPGELNPCDAVLAFMKASEAVVRQQQGTERAKSLDQVQQQFAPKMKGAPEKAIKAAENWVKEGSKFWDKSTDDSTFRLLQLRNAVLDACGKAPNEGGFR